MKKEGLLKLSCLFVVIMIFCITGCELPWDSSDTPIPIIRIVPQNQEISITERFSLEINVNNASNLFCMPFYLLYDTNYLKFDSASEGIFLNQNNMDPTSFLFSNDSARGRIIVGLTRLGQVPGVSGSGLLMTVYFEAINKGTTIIDFANVKAKTVTVTETESIPKSTPMSFIGSTIYVR